MADWATVQTDKRASCNKPSIMVCRLRIKGRNYKVGVELRRGTHDGGGGREINAMFLADAPS